MRHQEKWRRNLNISPEISQGGELGNSFSKAQITRRSHGKLPALGICSPRKFLPVGISLRCNDAQVSVVGTVATYFPEKTPLWSLS